MKKLFFQVSMLLCPLVIFAQEPSSGIQVSRQFNSDIPDIADLMAMSNIHYEKVQFTSKDLVGKNYAIRALEIWNGEVRDSSIIINSGTTKKTITDSIFELRVINQIDTGGNIVIRFATPLGSSKKLFKTIPKRGPLYSLRNIVSDSKKPVEIGKTFYLMAFILPIPMPDKPGYFSYCNVDNSGEDVLQWGKKLGIDHYIVYQMSFY